MKKNKFEHYKITSTSFDSIIDLKNKYPECESILRELKISYDVDVLHEIDATQLRKSFPDSNKKFDCIIFNFPHLGKENCLMHSAFISHVMHR